VWPNLTAQPAILGADVHCVPLVPRAGQWTLDLDALRAAITPATRLLIVNAPNNPTGWTLTRAEQQAILDHCRGTGTWILADEVYERLYYEPSANGCAPSFLDIAGADDRLVVAHSFSKSFLMTGWRLGWLVLPPALLGPVLRARSATDLAPPVLAQAALRRFLAVGELDRHLRRTRLAYRERRDRLAAAVATHAPGLELSGVPAGLHAVALLPPGADESAVVARAAVAGVGVYPMAPYRLRQRPADRPALVLGYAPLRPDAITEGVRRLGRSLTST
jgi:aspartate/methionine/tyrosine aminotransferase